MLVLSRRPNEKIILGGGITVTVVAITGPAVRLGIEAPPTVTIDRQEVAARRLAAAEGNGQAPR